MGVSNRLGMTTALAGGLLCLLVAAPSAPAAEDDPAAPMLQPYAIDVIDLQLPQASVETLEAEPEENYVQATFSLAESDGTPDGIGPFSEPRPIGIRLKGGNGSFRELKDEKAAFKIKFKEFGGSKFNGLKKLTLNNMVQDPSMLHETMTYEAFRTLGVPAPRTGFAFVYVNDHPYGVYLDVETYDDVSLPRWFASTEHLYEADAPGVDVRPDSQDEFEVDEGDEVERADLEALIAAANDETGDWSEGMDGVADLDEMAQMWAVERYVGHWDGYAGVAFPADPPFRPNNYYLHSGDAGLFSMLPWGTDQTWEAKMAFDEPAGGLLFNDCLADARCAAQYVEALRETQGAVAGLDLGTQSTCLAAKLAPWQAMEDAGRREYDEDEIADGVEEAEEFIAERPGELSTYLATQPGAGEGSAVGGPAPCGPPEPEPEPESESESETGTSSGSPTDSTGGSSTTTPPPPSSGGTRLKLLGFHAGRRQLSAEVRTGGAGILTLTAKMPTRKGARQVCGGVVQVGKAGNATVSCSLSAAARRRLRNRDLRLHMIAVFTPQAGERETAAGNASVPARRSG